MTTWFTADLHFGHRNIIDYCDRPFADVDEMNRALISNWNEAVDVDDTVWVLGDFALGKIAETLPLARELSGHKFLVAGNHDRCWAGHGSRSEEWVEKYLDAGFERVIQGSTSVDLDGQNVLLCHFPYRGDSQGEDRYPEARPVDHGGWLLHGHVHDQWSQSERMINVGVDVRDCAPVAAGRVIEFMSAQPSSRFDS